MRQALVQIMNAAKISAVNGSAFDVNQAVSASFQLVTGDTSSAGVLKLQVSNDLVSTGGYNRKNFTPTNWADIPNATSTVVSGVGPMVVVGNMVYSYIRTVWTPTASALVYTITMSATSPDAGHFRFNANGGNATIDFDNDAAGFQFSARLITGLENATVTGSFASGVFTITIPDATAAVLPVTVSNVTLTKAAVPVTATLANISSPITVNMNYLSL